MIRSTFDKSYLEVLGHAEAFDLLIAKDRSHGLVGREPLLVLRVLEILLLQVGPEPLDTLRRESHNGHWKQSGSYLRPRDLLTLLGPDDFCQLVGHVQLHLKESIKPGLC